MKYLVLFSLISLLLSSCSSEPEFPSGRWLLEVSGGDAYVNINDSIISISPIQYSCDTTTYPQDSLWIDSLLYSHNKWIIVPKTYKQEIKFELELDSKSKGFLSLWKKNEYEPDFSGEISIPQAYYPTFDELDSETKTLRWAFLPIKNDVDLIEKNIFRISVNTILSSQAIKIIEYIDSLEAAMNNSLRSVYDLECIHRDKQAYRYLATDFLIDDPANPTIKYFSANTLKKRLSSYYDSLVVKSFAQDLYDFENVRKDRNDIHYYQETWGIQEFYHVPYYNVILKFRQIKLAIYQIEKYKDIDTK